MTLTLAAAQTIVSAGLAHARKAGMRPLAMVVLDARAAVVAAATEDNNSLKRFDIARGKAAGALAFNLNSRRLGEMAVERPHFMAGVAHSIGEIVPVAGGVIVRDAGGAVIGAVGVSGDTSDNDEAAAAAGIKAAGLTPDGL